MSSKCHSFHREDFIMTDGVIKGGTNSNDNLQGTAGNDFLYGNGGADLLFGLDGNDTLDSGKIYDAATNSYLPDLVGDVLNGGAGNDTLTGGDGNDILIGGPGDDNMNGGGGTNTVVLSGHRSAYTVQQQGTTFDITGPDGHDIASNIQRLQFDDSAVAFDITGTAGQIYRLYQAAFDRKPDLPGMGFWIKAVENGLSMNQVATGFFASPEFQQMYAGANDHDFLVKLYEHALHREFDQDGMNFWTSHMANGLSREQVIIYFAESPENQAQVIGSIQNGIDYIPQA